VQIVLDWNVLQGMPAQQDYLAGKTCFLPETAAVELLTKSPASRSGLARKLQVWLQSTSAIVLCGRNIFELFKIQYELNRPLRLQDIVDPRSTNALRHWRRSGTHDLLARISNPASRDRVDPMEAMRQDWVEACHRMAHTLKPVYDGDVELRSTISASHRLRAYLHESDSYRSWSEKTHWPFFKAEWRTKMALRPMRFAVARWGKICLHYALKHLGGASAGFENNFDDAQYLLLASYTGHLATSDRGLREAAMVVFPKLVVWNPAQ
jgi:hypothetical protein